MITGISNNLKAITLLISEKDLVPVRSILNFMKEKFPSFAIMKFRTGIIGENYLVSFKVTNEFYPQVLEKFAYNDIPIILKDKVSQAFIGEKKEEKRRKLRGQGWSELSVNKKHISLNDLQKLAHDGKVKEIIKEAKGGVRANIEIVNKAKQLLTETINAAIKKLTKYAEEGVGKRQDAIDQLILIASDKDLRLFDKSKDINNAGLAAIEIALSNKNYSNNLIKIANNSKLTNTINIKAAIALEKIISNHSDDEYKYLEDVVKSLNTRWLRIAFDTIQKNLSHDEKVSMNNLIAFIEEKRTAA